MTGPLSDQHLDEIRRRDILKGRGESATTMTQVHIDRRVLLAELERLRGENERIAAENKQLATVRAAEIATALHEYANKLDAVPVNCTALTGPVWYGQGWHDATHHLHDLADGLMPSPVALAAVETHLIDTQHRPATPDGVPAWPLERAFAPDGSLRMVRPAISETGDGTAP